MLARKVFLQFFSDNLVNLLGFISTFCIARFMGPTILGTVGYSLSLLSVLSIFSDLGYSQAHIKRVSEGGDLNGKIGTFLLVRILLALIFSVTAILYLLFTGQSMSESDKIIYISFFVFYLASNIVTLASATFQGLSKTSLNNIPIILGRLSKTVSVIIIILLSLSAYWIGVSYVIDSLVVLIISMIFLYRITKEIKPNTKYLRNYTKFALPIAGISIISYLIGNADKLIIKEFWTAKEVGLYFGIQSLMALPQSISNALMTLLFPKFSELSKGNDIESLNLHLKEALRYLSLITIPVVLILLFYNNEIPLIFFGKQFSESSGIVIVASFTVLVINLTRPYSNLLFALEKGKYILLIGFVNLLVLLISDLILIPKEILNIHLFGLKGTGAALGIFNMWFINSLLTIYLVNKYSKIIFYEFIPKIIVVSLLSLVVLGIIKIVFPVGLLGIALGIVTFVLLYSLLTYITGLVNKTDIKYFKDIISPIKMGKYIKEEIKE